jgi:hypothetical protein
LLSTCTASAQQAKPTPKDSTPAAPDKNAAQIELLETKYRFESNGDSRKEVHARVRINNELGARQFARLNFDFNRSFQSVEIPFVRVTHASGGTVDILPSAITDNRNPAVGDYPAYHDVRVKSVRILGLQPDDVLEYRIVTTTTHHPLAPDFWLDHAFDRSGVVSREIFELELPIGLPLQMKVNPEIPQEALRSPGRNVAHSVYRWSQKLSPPSSQSETGPDIRLSTFKSWDRLASKLADFFFPTQADVEAMKQKALQISQGTAENAGEKYYEFVSQKIKTIDLSLDATGYKSRRPSEILQSAVATAEDKFVLFAALSGMTKAGLVSDSLPQSREIPSPAHFTYLVTLGEGAGSPLRWLDLNTEVAPIGLLPAQLHGKPTFVIEWPAKQPFSSHWEPLVDNPLFPSSQQVNCIGTLDKDGNLRAKVHYRMRGNNELLLRVAFHKSEKEKWNEVAQMLALSDGFRGQIVNVTASDPYATKEPFTVEYEISQPKFVDWSKKIVRIPAILPLPGLPDAPSAAQIEARKPIELGTPLAIDLEATIELPTGATAQAPIGTTVNRDYATFNSKYSVQGNRLQASRSLHFISSELPASRVIDFNAFLHAVQSDQSQLFTVETTAAK